MCAVNCITIFTSLYSNQYPAELRLSLMVRRGRRCSIIAGLRSRAAQVRHMARRSRIAAWRQAVRSWRVGCWANACSLPASDLDSHTARPDSPPVSRAPRAEALPAILFRVEVRCRRPRVRFQFTLRVQPVPCARKKRCATMHREVTRARFEIALLHSADAATLTISLLVACGVLRGLMGSYRGRCPGAGAGAASGVGVPHSSLIRSSRASWRWVFTLGSPGLSACAALSCATAAATSRPS